MLVSPVSVKSIFLKTEDLFRVLKMVSLWTPLIKIIIFFLTAFCFDSEILKEFCTKRKELISVSISSLTRQIQATCCFLYYLGVKKPYLHCSLNLLLREKRPTQISMFFTESAGFLSFFAKISSRSLKIT